MEELEITKENLITELASPITENSNAKLGLDTLPNTNLLKSLEKAAIKTVFYDFFNKNPFGNKAAKEKVFEMLIAEEPGLTVKQLDSLFRKAKNDFYASLPKQSPDVILAKMNEENELMKEMVIRDSNLDVVKQVEVIDKINNTIAKTNRLAETKNEITLNFIHDYNESLIKND